MKPFKLINQVQKYSWGTCDYIPELLGVKKTGETWAELWMGDHPRGSSIAMTESGNIPLNELIMTYSSEILGENMNKFGKKIPFLFKVLSAENPLSIQAHPNKEQASAGFREENLRGLALDAYNRNYKDSNHKPEIICALTPFTAMCGFCEPDVIESNFLKLNSSVFEKYFKSSFSGNTINRIQSFFSSLLSLEKESLNSLIESAIIWSAKEISIEAKLIQKFSSLYKNDPGILAPLFLNVYSLDPGEALYQGAGELHAYVEGSGIELMSNSDNVLRGGLTPKYVDVNELLKVLNFKSSSKNILKPKEKEKGVFEYPSPSNDFLLEYLKVDEQVSIEMTNHLSVSILLCISGDAVLSFKDCNIPFGKGESLLIPVSAGSYTLTGLAEIFSARMPLENK